MDVSTELQIEQYRSLRDRLLAARVTFRVLNSVAIGFFLINPISIRSAPFAITAVLMLNFAWHAEELTTSMQVDKIERILSRGDSEDSYIRMRYESRSSLTRFTSYERAMYLFVSIGLLLSGMFGSRP